jgi:preprotein translocase subunit SecB
MQTGSMIAGVENLNMEAVARVAQKAILDEIYLSDTKISRDLQGMPPKAITLEHKCSTKVLPIEIDKNVLSVICNFHVAAFDKKEPDKILMNIEASFCTSYVVEDIGDLNPNDIEHFSKINPVYNVWAYWREFVQSMTTRMGFPPLTVPLLKIMPKKTQKNEPKSKAVKKETSSRKKIGA